MRGQREGQPALPSLGGSATAGWAPVLPLRVAMGRCKGSSQPKGLDVGPPGVPMASRPELVGLRIGGEEEALCTRNYYPT